MKKSKFKKGVMYIQGGELVRLIQQKLPGSNLTANQKKRLTKAIGDLDKDAFYYQGSTPTTYVAFKDKDATQQLSSSQFGIGTNIENQKSFTRDDMGVLRLFEQSDKTGGRERPRMIQELMRFALDNKLIPTKPSGQSTAQQSSQSQSNTSTTSQQSSQTTTTSSDDEMPNPMDIVGMDIDAARNKKGFYLCMKEEYYKANKSDEQGNVIPIKSTKPQGVPVVFFAIFDPKNPPADLSSLCNKEGTVSYSYDPKTNKITNLLIEGPTNTTRQELNAREYMGTQEAEKVTNQTDLSTLSDDEKDVVENIGVEPFDKPTITDANSNTGGSSHQANPITYQKYVADVAAKAGISLYDIRTDQYKLDPFNAKRKGAKQETYTVKVKGNDVTYTLDNVVGKITRDTVNKLRNKGVSIEDYDPSKYTGTTQVGGKTQPTKINAAVSASNSGQNKVSEQDIKEADELANELEINLKSGGKVSKYLKVGGKLFKF